MPDNVNYPKIVITGTGLVTSLGLDCESTWRNVLLGRCGIGALTAVESRLTPDKGGGQVPDEDGDETQSPSPREVRCLRRAAQEALGQAGLATSCPVAAHRCAVILGTTLHGMRNGGAYLRTGDIRLLQRFLAGSTLSQSLSPWQPGGPMLTNCSACSSGLASILLGRTLLAAGEADIVIAGGYDPISEYAYAGFNAMRLVSPTTLRPFATTRDGMKVGEGYAVIVLERAERAASRGATSLAEISGFGESCDAHHLSKPHPEGAGAVSALRTALHNACLRPREIDLFIAHATATPDNDRSEHAALREVFGEHLGGMPVVGLKSHLGHTLGASGAVDVIIATLAMRDGLIPPAAAGTAEGKLLQGLHVVGGKPLRRTLRRVQTLSLGFGGANASVVLSLPADSPAAAPKPVGSGIDGNFDAVITGIGAVLPGAVGNDELIELANRRSHELGISRTIPQSFEQLIEARRTRRMSKYAKLCLAATAEGLRDAGIEQADSWCEECAAVVGTTHGPAEFCKSYYQQLIADGVDAANPTLFAEGVPNVASAHLSTALGLKGFCQTIIGSRTAGLNALAMAVHRIRTRQWGRAIVVAAEESTPIVEKAYRPWFEPTLPNNRPARSQSGVPAMSGGAVAFVVECRASAVARDATIRGTVRKAASASWPGCSVFEGVSRLQALIERLLPVDFLATSANTTQIDRLERAAIDRANLRTLPRQPRLAGLYGLMPEMFSVGPLAALAVAMLARRLPSLSWSAVGRPTEPLLITPNAVVGAICTGYEAGASGVTISLGAGSA
ncbi:MAG: beta-ketoacyl-[acyl-carrier-protein] synthase family protein [Phycisphaerae bacterium]|nr:beta-ketoacyl-[acyl-carrier-protein] synthase family protein [Phycisphaerae bacterium]